MEDRAEPKDGEWTVAENGWGRGEHVLSSDRFTIRLVEANPGQINGRWICTLTIGRPFALADVFRLEYVSKNAETARASALQQISDALRSLFDSFEVLRENASRTGGV